MSTAKNIQAKHTVSLANDGLENDSRIAAGEPGGLDADRIEGTLRTIIQDIDQFFSSWCRRLDECVESVDCDASADATLRKRIDHFRSEQLRYQSMREADERKLQERADLLSQAWLKLEAEQRKFLQLKANQTHTTRQSSSTSDGANHDHHVTSSTGRPPNVPAAPAVCASQERPLDSQPSSPPAPTRDSAVRQFEQLRREIEASRPNNSRATGTDNPNSPLAEDRLQRGSFDSTQFGD